MLSLRDLSIGFRRYAGLVRREEVTRLAGLNLELAPGRALAVIGASGAGKSLLAHAVLGLLPPNAVLRGEMRLAGCALTGVYPADLRGRHIALVPQDIGHLDPLAKVGRQIGWATRRAALGLPAAMADRYPDALSGGTARRVLLAPATAGRPDLLIADEPTAGLDPDNRDMVLRLIRDTARAGRAVLIVTHDLRAALPVADRVSILEGGRMQEIESAAAFRGDGGALGSRHARALWRALPENGFFEARALSAGFYAPLFRDLDLALPHGGILGLHGPSGSGKTTLGRVLAGLHPPRSGAVLLNGAPLPTRGAGPVQYLPQSPILAMNPRWRIGRALAEAARPDPADLDAFGIAADWHDRFPHELSGGQLQRVSILRPLSARPRYLVADEITAALDAVSQAQVWHLLRARAARERIGILAISHDHILLDHVCTAGRIDMASLSARPV